MKKNNVEVIFEALGEIDDEILQQAFSVDDKKAFDAVKNDGQQKSFVVFTSLKRVAAACLILAVAFLAVAVGVKWFSLDKEHNDGAMVESLLSQSQVNSEMEDSTEISAPEVVVDDTPSGQKPQTPSHNVDTPKTESSFVESLVPESSEIVSESPSESSDITPENPDDKDESDAQSKPETSKPLKITSIDMLNYYSAMRMLEGSNTVETVSQNLLPYYEDDPPFGISLYKIDSDTEFVIKKVMYFKVVISNPNSFLAKKLGGEGEVEVVVTENNFDDMITFKKGNAYYSCLLNGFYLDMKNMTKEVVYFSTHKYIDGLYAVKNWTQENYQVYLYFEQEEIVDISCEYFITNNLIYQTCPGDIELVDGSFVSTETEQTYTIEQLENYYSNVFPTT